MVTASHRQAIEPTLVAETPGNGVDDSVARPIPRDRGRSILNGTGGRQALLAGRYRIDQELAEGGMSIVFRAWHVALEQPVAIKMMREELVSHSEAVERFLREAQAMALLRGKHAVRVMDVSSTANGVPFMVLEYLEGRDLRQVLVESGPLPVERAVSFVIQACTAVAEAHAHGLIHRDLKPDNLFLQTDHDGFEILKVIDYGISKCLNKKSKYETRSEFHLGSPQYMSPEQVCSARSVDARTDVWSLGVVLYELLTGRAPFQGATLPAICAAVLKDEPPSPRTLREDLPEALEAIIMRCLAKRRGDRFGSIERLVDALTEFQRSSMPLASADRSPGVEEPPISHCALIYEQPISLAPTQARDEATPERPQVRGSKARYAVWGIASVVLLAAGVSLPDAQSRAISDAGGSPNRPSERTTVHEFNLGTPAVRALPAAQNAEQSAAAPAPSTTSTDSAAAVGAEPRVSRAARPVPRKARPRKASVDSIGYGLSDELQQLSSSETTKPQGMSRSPESGEQDMEARYALTYQAPSPERAKSESDEPRPSTTSSFLSHTGRD